MKYTEIAAADGGQIAVSKVAFGGAVVGDFHQFSYYCDALEQYCALGGTLIDTGLCYGGWSPDVPDVIEVPIPAGTTGSWVEHGYSSSELMIGQWLKRHGRANVVIATKGAHPAFGKMTVSRVNETCIARDLACSLRNLDVNCIDLYFLHRDDYEKQYPVSKIIDELNRHVDRGEIRALGVSNWTGERIEQANDYAEKHRLAGFTVNQICFSLAQITKEQIGDETLVCMDAREYAYAKQLGMAVMAYTSQAGGFFSKFAEKSDEDALHSRYGSLENVRRLHRVKTLAREKGMTPAEINIAYLTSLDVNVIPIVGFSSPAQLTESVAAGGYTLTPEETAFLTT